MEYKIRSILKAISYRIICIISMMVIMLTFTKNVSQSIYVTVICLIPIITVNLLPSGGNAGHYAGMLGDPRTLGITLRYSFQEI